MRTLHVWGRGSLLLGSERDGQLQVQDEVGSEGEVGQRGWRMQEARPGH